MPEELIRTKADERAVAEGCYYDDAAARKVRTFFEKYLRHSKGRWAGQPFTLLPWQWERLIRPLFGWKRPDGTRRFRMAYIEVPKKNGKSE
ncbi:MAG TPA: terminase large subunit, partial [Phycisphaerae bacterium]|nr:terminase large subunit [Phycisphaerae bacterium]